MQFFNDLGLSKLISDRLAKLAFRARRSTGNSQRAFAEYLTKERGYKISYSTVQNLESGKISKIDPELWNILAPLAGFTYLEALNYINEDGDYEPSDTEKILRDIDELTIDNVAIVLQRLSERFNELMIERIQKESVQERHKSQESVQDRPRKRPRSSEKASKFRKY